jgi:Ca2+-transporting ATPase
MDDETLMELLPRIVVIARSMPSTKMRIVKLLKAMGLSVAVTGDGINDAPALKNADVGVAMGITGTAVSKEAADIVLLDDSFSTIAMAIMWGRGVFENFRRFIQFQLTVNVAAFGAAVLAEICNFGMPLTTLQLLWINIIMDGPPALSLGLEPPRNHLMDNDPIPRNENIISKDMLFRIVSHGAIIIGALTYLMETDCLGGSPAQQSTIVFTSFVLFQLWNAFNCREFGTISVIKNIFANKTMLVIMAVTFGIQICVTQFGGRVFQTVPLEFGIWCNIILYTFGIIVFSEVIKVIRRILRT